MRTFAMVRPALVVIVTALAIAAQSFVPVTAFGAPPPPTIAITAPAAGATVKGTIAVTAAATAGAGDTASSVTLYDGVNTIGNVSCQSQAVCAASINWNATGLSGPHSLTARVSTGAGLSATSAPVVVSVVSPPPVAAVVTPVNGATVEGKMTVTATAATDPSQADYPTSITILDGVNTVGSGSCQGQTTCQVSVSWDVTGAAGTRTLTASVRTSRGLSAVSPPAVVKVVSPAPKVRITSPKSGAASRRVITIWVSGATDPSQIDYPTSIAVYDGATYLGSVSCQGQRTCGGSVKLTAQKAGLRHALYAVIHTETSRSVTSKTVHIGGPVAKRTLKPSCHLEAAHVAAGQIDHGTCSIPGAPTGTAIEIDSRLGAGPWVASTHGTVAAGGIYRFKLHGNLSRTYALRVHVSASRTTKAATKAIGTLRIA